MFNSYTVYIVETTVSHFVVVNNFFSQLYSVGINLIKLTELRGGTMISRTFT